MARGDVAGCLPVVGTDGALASKLVGVADAHAVIPVFAVCWSGRFRRNSPRANPRYCGERCRTLPVCRIFLSDRLLPNGGSRAACRRNSTEGPADSPPSKASENRRQAVAVMRCFRSDGLKDRFRFHRGPPVERVEQARDGRYPPPVVAVIVPPVFGVQRQVEANGLREAQGGAHPGTDASIMAVAANPTMTEPQTSAALPLLNSRAAPASPETAMSFHSDCR